MNFSIDQDSEVNKEKGSHLIGFNQIIDQLETNDRNHRNQDSQNHRGFVMKVFIFSFNEKNNNQSQKN